MNHETHTLCSVCSQTTVITDHNHKYKEKFYSLITKIIQAKRVTDKKDRSILNNITNLVFQGGGVKGLAYLGALKELEDGDPNFLKGIKRIAGTSAGSIVALYLGLGLDINEDIDPLMKKEYSSLLDDGLVLKVTLNPKVWNPESFADRKNFKAKDIILQALKYFADIRGKLKAGRDPQAKKKAEDELRKAINLLFSYYGSKVGVFAAFILKIKTSDFAADATKWLLNLLKSDIKTTSDLYHQGIAKNTFPSSYSTFTGDPNGQSLLDRSVGQEIEKVKRSARQKAPSDDLFRNDASAYASTEISEDSLFDDIINEECSGFLSESEQASLDAALRYENSTVQTNSGGYTTTQDILRNSNVANHLDYSNQGVRLSDYIAPEPYSSTKTYQTSSYSSTTPAYRVEPYSSTPNYQPASYSSTTPYQAEPYSYTAPTYRVEPYSSTTYSQPAFSTSTPHQVEPYSYTTTYQASSYPSTTYRPASYSSTNPSYQAEPYSYTTTYQAGSYSSTTPPYRVEPYPSTTTNQAGSTNIYQADPYPSMTTYTSTYPTSQVGSILGNTAQNRNLYDEPLMIEKVKRAGIPRLGESREGPGSDEPPMIEKVKRRGIPIPRESQEESESIQKNNLDASPYDGSPAHIRRIVRETLMQAEQQQMPAPKSTNVEMRAREIHQMSVSAAPLVKPVLVSQQQSNGGLRQRAEEMPPEKQTTKAKQADAEEYMKNYGTDIVAAPKEELTPDILPYALGELLWFCIISQQNAAGVQEKLGLFNGSRVKKELIEDPIVNRLRKMGLPDDKNVTFGELMSYNEVLPEHLKFKNFYVTAFNTETSKTEVFSAEHTPNVVIADAVRASMSIPIFFTPVKIREKQSGELKARTCFNGVSRNEVNYMDGGILDNYPMWIFDDIKYCFDESFQIPSDMRCPIQNPHTLGLRLLDLKTIQRYTDPTQSLIFHKEDDEKFQDKFSYQIGLLVGAFMSHAQENEHLKRGDCARSVYVNNLGVSAVKFSLSDREKANLVQSGRDSVKSYLARASNNFKGEGQLHHQME